LKNIDLETAISKLKTRVCFIRQNTLGNKVARLVQIILNRLRIKNPKEVAKVEAVAELVNPEVAENALPVGTTYKRL
jgi:hypothetical protein